MRLQLILGIAALAAALPRRAAAEPPPDSASATVRVYADDDRLTVISPAAHGQLTRGRVSLDVDLAVDAVTAASVDVMTSASPVAVSEQRYEAGVGVTLAAGRATSIRAGGQLSHENDYDAFRVALGVIRELASRNTTLELRVGAGKDYATAVGDPTFSGERATTTVTAVVTQLASRHAIVDVTAEGSAADGWQGSPYRTVWISDPAMPVVIGYHEATPARRLALAVAVRGRRAFGERWFGSAIARGYLDDWDVHSATATVELRRRWSERTLVGAQLRGYLQDGASFWVERQPDATAPPRYRTADRTLGPMATGSLELIGDRVVDDHGRRVVVAVGGIRFWYLDNLVQDHRLALTATVSFVTPL